MIRLAKHGFCFLIKLQVESFLCAIFRMQGGPDGEGDLRLTRFTPERMPCDFRAGADEVQDIRCVHGQGPGPVSYTHLDVYKRQATPRANAAVPQTNQ